MARGAVPPGVDRHRRRPRAARQLPRPRGRQALARRLTPAGAMSDAFKPLLAKLADGATLSEDDGRDFFAACLRGEPSPAQVAAAVTAMRMRGETVGEISPAPKREGKEDIAWLAWIPIVSQFLMTWLVEKDVHPGIRGKFTILYGVAVVVSFLLSSAVFFVTLIPTAMIFYAFYFIAKRYSTNPVLHVVIGIITVSTSIPISLFMFRNREIIANDVEIIE